MCFLNGRFRRTYRLLILASLSVVCLMTAAFPVSPACAQIEMQFQPLNQVPTGDLPGQDYWNAHVQYREAEYRRAGNDFARGAQTAFKYGTNRFLDSCCYWVMNGECRLHMGDYAGAIEQYELAIKLYLQYTRDNWQGRVTQPNIALNNTAVQRAQITWYTPQRQIAIPGLPDSMQMMFGRLDAERAFVEGGAVQNPEFRNVNAIEFMRTIAIALQRRRWIKGPICQYDPFSKTILDTLKTAGTGDASLLSKCNQVLFGLALAGNGELDRAREQLGNSLQFGAGMDHPLTPFAMLELARILAEQGDPASALTMAMEASFSAAVFQNVDVVEQSLALASELHLRANRAPYPPLQPAIVWAARNRAPQMQISLAIRQADGLAESGASPASLKMLDDAQRLGARSDVLRGPLSGRLIYLRAVNLFAAGDFAAGSEALVNGLKNYAPGSRWLYQINLVNQSLANRVLTTRQADLMYGLLLGDPGEIHWRTDPIEAMSFLASPHLPSIETWLDIAIENRSYDRAVEIAELLRRHRFFSTQPLAGRLLSMRWVMHGPDEAVGEASLAQRADFLTRVPAYAELTRLASQTRQSLLAIPVQPAADSDREKEQRNLFVQMMKTANQQESLLASMALKREPAGMVFPPATDLSQLRSMLTAGSVVLYAIQTERACHIFEISPRATRLLASHRIREVPQFVNRILKELSLTERQLKQDQLQSVEWKQTLLEQTAALLPGFAPPQAGSALVIIPDGTLWNLPFEVLLFGTSPDDARFLVDACTPRYAPTLNLAIVPSRRSKPPVRNAIFSGQLDKSLPIEPVRDAVRKLAALTADSGNWEERLMIPSSLLGSVLDQMIVLTGMEMPRREGPFGLLPAQKDVGRTGNTLAAWQSLPFEGADVMLLPCFESAGATGVTADAGQDLFLTTMGLVASGSRTVLISRWPTRGKSAIDLTTNYVELAGQAPAAEALQAARKKVRELALEFPLEPRTEAPGKPADPPVQLLMDHPLFWAGYMVIDLPTIPDRNPATEAAAAESAEAKPSADGAAGTAPGDPVPGDPAMPAAGMNPDANKQLPPADPQAADKPPTDPGPPDPAKQEPSGNAPAGAGGSGGGNTPPGNPSPGNPPSPGEPAGPPSGSGSGSGGAGTSGTGSGSGSGTGSGSGGSSALFNLL